MLAKLKQNSGKKQQFFDRQRLEAALSSSFKAAPHGMSREQKRAFMSGKG